MMGNVTKGLALIKQGLAEIESNESDSDQEMHEGDDAEFESPQAQRAIEGKPRTSRGERYMKVRGKKSTELVEE